MLYHQSAHDGELASSALRSQANIQASSARDSSKACGPCPLCYEVQLGSEREYSSHVGKHLENLALFALPRVDDDYSTGDESTDEEDEDVALESDGENIDEPNTTAGSASVEVDMELVADKDKEATTGSGVKVVKLVLAHLALATKALRGYMYREHLSHPPLRELNNVLKILENEKGTVESSCKSLLVDTGAIPFHEISECINDPWSPRWRETEWDNRLRTSLADDYQYFDNNIRGLHTAVVEFNEKLGLRENRLREIEVREPSLRHCLHIRLYTPTEYI